MLVFLWNQRLKGVGRVSTFFYDICRPLFAFSLSQLQFPAKLPVVLFFRFSLIRARWEVTESHVLFLISDKWRSIFMQDAVVYKQITQTIRGMLRAFHFLHLTKFTYHVFKPMDIPLSHPSPLLLIVCRFLNLQYDMDRRDEAHLGAGQVQLHQ